HEIESGYPWIAEASRETAVAQMLNQHTIGGVHFKKGCYPGQEIIARAQYRGQVKRGLAVLAAQSLEAPGVVLRHNGEEAGIIINSVPAENGSLCLAVIKHAVARAQYRGQVKRGLAVLGSSSLEAAGVAVHSGGEEAGIIINSALTGNGSTNLAVIKFSASETPLTDADGSALQTGKVFFKTDNE
ncbi:folate-binding protein YgfZ, partial [Neisseria dentiae]|uniref:CAF17-like 4Fe-4S cluster assembly/insertion protein YgfZ n=1 Tax=Neisseria dentiae TaxID=194197 RepID=UPI0035A062E9